MNTMTAAVHKALEYLECPPGGQNLNELVLVVYKAISALKDSLTSKYEPKKPTHDEVSVLWRSLVLKHTKGGSCNFEKCAQQLVELVQDMARKQHECK